MFKISPSPANQPDAPAKTYLPEVIVKFSGQRVSIRQFPSGDIAVRVVAYDPDLVSLIRCTAKVYGGRFNLQYKMGNMPGWIARIVGRSCETRLKTLKFPSITHDRNHMKSRYSAL